MGVGLEANLVLRFSGEGGLGKINGDHIGSVTKEGIINYTLGAKIILTESDLTARAIVIIKGITYRPNETYVQYDVVEVLSKEDSEFFTRAYQRMYSLEANDPEEH